MTSGRAALHPLTLLALAVLIGNDHVLKAAWPGWCTGKLSDVAGLACFPVLVAAGGELCGLWPGGRRTLIAIAVATGVAFAAVKLWTPAGDLYRIALAALQWPLRASVAVMQDGKTPALGRAQLTPDPGDLLTLPALALGPWLLARGAQPRPVPARARLAPGCPARSKSASFGRPT